MIGGVVAYTALWLVGIAQILNHDGGSTTRRAVGAAIIAAHLLVVWWVAGYRVANAAAFAGPEDVVIRNTLSSRRIRWGDIERFTVEPAGAWRMGYVKTTDGESIPITGIQGQNRALFPNSKWAEGPIDELNRLLEQHRCTSGRDGDPSYTA